MSSMTKKKTRNKVLAVLVILILIAGWIVSILGAGPVENLSKQLKYGLDINGGVYVLLEADTKDLGADTKQVMEQTKSVIENRVNAMGISEASVSIEGTNRIRVELPGVDNAEDAIQQIGRTAQLKFLLADGTEVLTGDAIKDAGYSTDDQHGGYKITMEFTADGEKAFADATEKAASGSITSAGDEQYIANNAIVIMLDDEVISAPTVDEKIDSRDCEIYKPGGFTQEEASETAALIRGGALPASLTEVNSSVETATIGENALNMSVKAGLIGLALVFLIMIIIYGALGVIADIALSLYICIVLWIMVFMGSVLTLPGIAGIILSIGMAVDSNVIIFTRIREEIANGRSPRIAADNGFHSALSTIIDSQTTTLIASIVLYLIGTTSVKGFALTLMIGTIVSIFTAVVITQLLVGIMAESKMFGKPKWFGIKADGTPRLQWKGAIGFIKNRKKFYAISAIVIVLGVAFAGIKGFNYGIDFTGGTMIQMDMGKQVELNDVKKTISEYDLDPTIIYAGQDKEQIVIKTKTALKSTERAEVIKTIEDKYDLNDKAVLASEEFGPTVGKELRHNAVKAIIIAALFMLAYIRLRFKTWKFGLAAVSGLAHDVLVTLAMYAIFGFTINNPFIAGILTVVGYSINDTIVIFDRIRENIPLFKKKELSNCIDTSINQTLSRSLMTSITTLIVMVPLFIFATDEIRQFLIPLMIGVLVGTYSSIFMCSPIFFELSKKSLEKKYKKADGAKKESKDNQDKDKAIV